MRDGETSDQFDARLDAERETIIEEKRRRRLLAEKEVDFEGNIEGDFEPSGESPES
jgi:hypothetical protein